jgi:hypothetical protein
MSIAEILLSMGLIAGVYFVLKPVQQKLEQWLLAWMGRPSGRKGQGSVYRMNRKSTDHREDH